MAAAAPRPPRRDRRQTSATPAPSARSATRTTSAEARAARLGVLPPELLDGREPARAWPTPRPVDFVGLDRFMWGSDYPHDEGTYPHSREHLRSRFHELAPAVLHKILAANAAELYDFDLDALAPLAPSSSARRSPSCAEPLTELPENPSQGLCRDFDTRAL